MEPDYASAKGPPERWQRCPRRGEPIQEARMLPFKVPLDSRYNDQIPMQYRFSPAMVVEWAKDNDIKLGLVIDLTKANKDRFYRQEEFTSRGVQVLKLPCEGHGSVPTPLQVDEFVAVCSEYLEKNPDSYIGVHCTHGFNRTGYMICSYLYQYVGFAMDTAIGAFTASRPPGIYKPYYIQELLRSGGMSPDTVQAPPYPDWDTPNGDEAVAGVKRTRSADSDTEDGDGGSRPRLDHGDAHQANEAGNAEANADETDYMVGLGPHPGVERVEGPEAAEVRGWMRQVCRWQYHTFPGAQPVSLTRSNLDVLAREPYTVSWKADGTRYLMAIRESGVYMADRNFRIFRVNMHFPEGAALNAEAFQKARKAGQPLEPVPMVNDTLVDGELVIDLEGTVKTPRFLMYDLVCLHGNDLLPTAGAENRNAPFQNYLHRLHVLEMELVMPRRQAEYYKAQYRHDFAAEPFRVRVKTFGELYQAGHYAKLKTGHETDGLIFAPLYHSYHAGTDERQLKWKPPHANSIDFRLKMTVVKREGQLRETVCRLMVRGAAGEIEYDKVPYDMPPYGNIFGMSRADLTANDGKIIECALHNVGRPGAMIRAWHFMRVREDKSTPNAKSVADNVKQSIEDGIEQAELLEYIRQIAPLPPPKPAAAAPTAISAKPPAK